MWSLIEQYTFIKYGLKDKYLEKIFLWWSMCVLTLAILKQRATTSVLLIFVFLPSLVSFFFLFFFFFIVTHLADCKVWKGKSLVYIVLSIEKNKWKWIEKLRKGIWIITISEFVFIYEFQSVNGWASQHI